MVAAGLFIFHDFQEKQVSKWVETNTQWNPEVTGETIPKAPTFNLNNLNGEGVSLADLEGKVVMLNFWTTWCPNCKINMPHMDLMYHKYKEEGFVMLAINATSQERNPDAVEEFINDSGYSFPVLLDENGDVSKKYRVTAFPTSFIINRQGEVVYSKLGSFQSKETEMLIKKLLNS